MEIILTALDNVVRPLKRSSRLVLLVLVVCRMGIAQAGPTQQVSSLPGPGQQLTLLQSLESTLVSQPQLQIQLQQVEISRAIKQQATGQFDLALAGGFSQAHTNSPLTLATRELLIAEGFVPTSNLAQNLSVLDLGVTKQYRTGVQISPFYETTRTTDNVSTAEGTNMSHLALQVTIPLLRGRGRQAVAAQETAAAVEVTASTFDRNQTISSLLASTSSSYWQAVAATKQLQVASSSEDRGRAYVDNVQTLINAGRVARTEINQVAANLAVRTAGRIAAEQNLLQAQQQLALAMGLGVDLILGANFSFEDFPEPDSQKLLRLEGNATAQYVQQALIERADYRAAQKRIAESRVLLIAAQNALKPQLNLNFQTGYSGLSEGTAPAQFFNSAYHSIQGLDAVAGAIYSFPLRNNLATGEVRQALASLNQAQLRAADLGRSIASSVVTAVSAVRNAARQLDQARESVRSSEAALQGERDKFKLGFNSLVDVLTVEDRLTTAMTTEVSAELAYALALTQLRFATGTIVEPDKEVHSVNPDCFLTLP